MAAFIIKPQQRQSVKRICRTPNVDCSRDYPVEETLFAKVHDRSFAIT
ncbi:hypothetical protein [Barnesiella intestinihominis]|nr:hypothetical protein [Barnesiella intestinihominis]